MQLYQYTYINILVSIYLYLYSYHFYLIIMNTCNDIHSSETPTLFLFRNTPILIIPI